MRLVLVIALGLLLHQVNAQQTVNTTKKGVAADGYDVVAYFENQAVVGDKSISSTYHEAIYYFSTQSNKELFDAHPEKYLPQYGGWCAYAMGDTGELVEINPKRYEIRDGKLYLFYDAFGINTLKKWEEEGAERLKSAADLNWEKLAE